MKQLIIIGLLPYYLFSGLNPVRFENPKTDIENKYISPCVKIKDGRTLLKEGDLVVRLNRDPSSRYIKYFNRRDKRYSHSGIVLFENGYPYVYHIVNGYENPDEKLRRDSLAKFCDPNRNMAYGIFRYEISADEISRLKEIIHKLYRSGIRFDNVFNFKTDDRMYCSEMISKSLAVATDKRILIEPTPLTSVEATFLSAYGHLPFSYTNNLGVVSIDDLYLNGYCHFVKAYIF